MLQSLDLGIYERYYQGAKRDGLIWTLVDYVDRKGLVLPNDSDDPYDNAEISKHGDAIRHVLTLEIAIYVFRHLNGTWGEVIDEFRCQLTVFKNEYQRTTGYYIHTGNPKF